MKQLLQGMESKQKIELLLQLTKITRDDIINAILDHFVRGLTMPASAAINIVKRQNLAVSIESLEKVANIVEQINELKKVN